MKNILITGANSYIGTSFEKWMTQWSDQYQIDTLDMIGDGWREKDFSLYDTVFHVAGIAHVSSDPKLADLYYKVNCDLTIETAQKAKAEGVKQFIFMSSAIVYGDSAPIGKMKVITKNTEPSPTNFYGDSKVKAEEGIRHFNDDHFKVVVLRPPMIYGKGSKGNYPILAKYAVKLPVFPNVENARSMLHIDNLCEFIRLMIDNDESGLFFPQNSEYVRTSDMVKMIADLHDKNMHLTKCFNWVLRLMNIGLVNKVFGSLAYDLSMSQYEKGNYQIRDFRESLIRTEL